MRSSLEQKLWKKGITPPGYIKVEPEVVGLITGFLEELRKLAPEQEVVATLDWAYRLESREDLHDKSKWGDPFVRIGGLEKEKVAPEEIEKIGDIELIIQIPQDICAQAKERRICCKPGHKSRMELR